MENNKAFTLVEVLISLFISSFIIFGMIQLYRNLQNFIDKTSTTMNFNRRVYLLFSQLEKDFSTMFIPKLKQENKSDQNLFMVGDFFEGEYNREKGKRLELFKSVSFINTNPFIVYDKKNVKLVRVAYLLQKNKQLSKPDKNVYDLFRKETLDLNNSKFEQKEIKTKEGKFLSVKEYLVAKNIKYFSVEYQGFEKDQKKKNKKDKKEKMIKTFTWGKDEKTKNILPKKVLIRANFWDNKLLKDSSYSLMIPIFTKDIKKSSAVTDKNENKDKKQNKKQDSIKTEDKKQKV
ncbi:hypothetical protein GF385_04665 [Candidatus Dependentiae bacterium]|nr:hypothetical protein [Candidatus Dependentiae bacterium]